MSHPAPPLETPFGDEAGFRAALDAVIASATREIRIFDNTLENMKLDDKVRAEALRRFLAESPLHRLHIGVHEARYAESHCPRLLALIRQFPASIEFRESAAEYKHIADCCLLADGCNGAIRFHRDHARGKLLLNVPDEIRPRWQRFDELWQSGTPCLAATTLGL